MKPCRVSSDNQAVIVGHGSFVVSEKPGESKFQASGDSPPLNEICSAFGIHVGKKTNRLVFLLPDSMQEVSPFDCFPPGTHVLLAVVDDGSKNFSDALAKLKAKYPARSGIAS